MHLKFLEDLRVGPGVFIYDLAGRPVGTRTHGRLRRHHHDTLDAAVFGCAEDVERAVDRRQQQLTALPPRGWNSYDSSWIIDEAAYLDNARIMANRLLPHGYQVGDGPIHSFIRSYCISSLLRRDMT